ncbi:hypothetical protein [Rossellomorea marisflavi]|uniref:Uncharacterized protein n=1 Tax=Rossellomorea marisflavi TaxID=189381 RepID=A0A165L1Q5_9BACI|nr:hypothetical protein [Rossellomorea marisflavi]KZE50752.1 hypothetical protein AV649_15295 [Rossellomorea marisflavi]
MNPRTDHEDEIDIRKTKNLTGIGCLLAVVLLILLLPFIIGWLFFRTGETTLEISSSPHDVHTIEVVKVDEFPDPVIDIRYGDQVMTKTKIPDEIKIHWESDQKATVTLIKGDRKQTIPIIFD